jgi:protein-disulfide isomerase
MRSNYNLPPDMKVIVGPITAGSDWPNYDTVTVTMDSGGGKKSESKFLISKDRHIMMRMTKFDLTKDPYVELMSKIDLTGRPTRGAKSAKVLVVNYDDFECPFCSRMHQTLFPGLFKEYGDRVTFVYKDYPLEELHPWAIHAAVDANCLASQNADAYWDYADYIHANQKEFASERTPGSRLTTLDHLAALEGQKHNLDQGKLQACVQAQDDRPVKASMKEAESIGVSATPTLFINGEKIDGAVPIADVRAALDRALRDAGQPVPDHGQTAPPSPSK